MFSLVCALPSPASAEGCPSLFGWFIGTTAQSDFSCAFMSAVRFMAFADRSWSFDQDVQEISRFSCMLFLSVRGFFDYAGPINPLAIGVVVVLPSSLPERSRHPDPSVFRSSIARPTDTSVYASSGTSRCRLQDSRPGWSRCLLSCRVGIELGRADVRPRVSSPALSVAEWVPSSAIATFPQAPLRSRMVGFPESGSDLGNAHKPS